MSKSRSLATALASQALLLLVVACGVSQAPELPATNTPGAGSTPPPVAATPKVRFIAFGDAGRANANQTAVGAAMAQLCKVKGCDFAIETGDNFYNAGVGSTTDSQWQDKFEVPYKDFNFPVYATLGNHDNSSAQFAQAGLGEGSDNSRGNFQVAYTTATGMGISGKWKMPARYYNFTAPLNPTGGQPPIIEFFSLDSAPLAATAPNPADTTYLYATYGPTQMQWFQQALTNTKAKWTVAFGHHPYISNGNHGNAGTFDGVPANTPGTSNGKPWKDLMDGSACAQKLDLYIFGHDHDLEWLKPVATCNSKTEFILTGAASDVRAFGSATRNPSFWQQDNAQGFYWFEVTDTTFTGEVYFFTDGKLPVDAAGAPKPAFTRTITK